MNLVLFMQTKLASEIIGFSLKVAKLLRCTSLTKNSYKVNRNIKNADACFSLSAVNASRKDLFAVNW